MAWQEPGTPAVLCLQLICYVTSGICLTSLGMKLYTIQEPVSSNRAAWPRVTQILFLDQLQIGLSLSCCGGLLSKGFLFLSRSLFAFQASGLCVLGQMAHTQDFLINFNIQSNIIGTINLKKKRKKTTREAQ